MTETEMTAACRRGDRDAQRELYERTSQRVYRLLLRMTRDPESALDLAQNAYLKAFVAISAFDGRASVSTWLYRIAVNEALQFLRRATPVPLSPEFAASRPDPGHNGHQPDMQLDVEKTLASVEPTDRAILLLRYQEGLDYKTISEIMNIAMGTVGSRLNRARERVQIALADYSNCEEERTDLSHRTQCGQADAVPRSPVRKSVQ